MPNRTIWDGKESEQMRMNDEGNSENKEEKIEDKMNEKIDEKIRAELIRTADPLPESYEKRIKEVLQNLPDEPLPEKKKRWWLFPKTMTLAVMIGVVAVSSGVAAGVRLYQKRLASMKPEQVEEMYSAVQDQQVDADRYSREMLGEEEEKFRELKEKYEREGLFPQKEIACVETEKDVAPGELCYCYENGMFYLPERELSEEELLQIVDFQYKARYSLDKVQEGREGDAPGNTEGKVADINGTEEGDLAAEKGKQLLEDLYGWDTDGAECTVERDEEGDFDVVVEKKGWEHKVKIVFEKDTMKFMSFLFLENIELREIVGIKISKKDFKRYEKIVWKMAKKILAKEDIMDFSFGFHRCKDGTVLNGKVIYFLTCKNGEGLVIYFNTSEGVAYQVMNAENVSEWINLSEDLNDYEFIQKKNR